MFVGKGACSLSPNMLTTKSGARSAADAERLDFGGWQLYLERWIFIEKL